MEYVNFNCPDCSKTHTCSVCKRCNRNLSGTDTTTKGLTDTIRVSAEKIQDVIQQGPVYTNPGCEVYEVSLKELTAWNQALRTAYNLITKAP